MSARTGRHALVLADGDRPDRAALDAAWPGWQDGADLVVAADGGAALARGLGLRIDRWVGDADSIAPELLDELRADGIAVALHRPDKDESDTELAVLEAVDHGATVITVVGALGGRRLDHHLANVGLLSHPRLESLAVRLIDERTRVSLLRGPGSRSLAGPVGATVSLLPVDGPADGIVTEGLEFPLRDEALLPGPARGLSNRRTREDAAVSLRRGRLLVVESAANLTG
jgi:thiamine pyrophosphokinase